MGRNVCRVVNMKLFTTDTVASDGVLVSQ